LIYAAPKKVSDKQLASAEIILGNLPPERLKGASRLKWIQLGTAGSDIYCAQGILPPGTILTNATGAFGLAISEYMLGVVLELNYNLYKYRDNQKKNLWRDEGRVCSLAGCTVLVVGLGDIGGAFAAKMKNMGSRVIGIRRTLSDKPEFVDELYRMDSLDDLLPEADVVALSLPNSPATAGLMTGARLLAMKRDAILVNVGRGSAVCTEDLCRILAAGHLKGCALDVTDPEPLPADHPLWNFENVVITPHISGRYHIREILDTIADITAHNLKAYLAGGTMKSRVDFATGYRSRC
jgi:Phosphoglycerate dehydrogenase and related dehydrogenases